MLFYVVMVFCNISDFVICWKLEERTFEQKKHKCITHWPSGFAEGKNTHCIGAKLSRCEQKSGPFELGLRDLQRIWPFPFFSLNEIDGGGAMLRRTFRENFYYRIPDALQKILLAEAAAGES